MSKHKEAEKAERATAESAAETATATPIAERATPPAEGKGGKKVKVKFLRSHPEYAYWPNEEAEIDADAFERISKDGPFFEKL